MKNKKILVIIVLFILIFMAIISNYYISNSYVQDGKRIIDDGIYTIVSAGNNNMVVDINGPSNDNNANATIWQNNNGNNQKFKINYLGNEFYTITSVYSNKFLTLTRPEKSNGLNVNQYEYMGSDTQIWKIQKTSDGYYNIVSKANGFYLDITGAIFENGINLEIWQNNGGINQKFMLLGESPGKTIDDGIYEISSCVNPDFALDITGASLENGANLELWQYNADYNQKFRIIYLNDGYYSIYSINSGKSLDVYNNESINGTNVEQFVSNGGNNQKWQIKKTLDGKYNIISKCNGLYLDVCGGHAANGTNILMWQNNSGTNQKFEFTKVEVGTKSIENGIYQIKSFQDPNLVLDVTQQSTQNGANITLWQNNDQNNQKYRFEYLGNGYYTIKAVHSGKSLNVENGSKKNGANVNQYTWNGLNNQKWQINHLGNGIYNIVSTCNNLYLDITSNAFVPGTNIEMWLNNGGNNQKFILEKVAKTNPDIPDVPEEPTEYIGETGTYGTSGLKHARDSRGSDLKYYKYGIGKNVYFATFAVHGWEDNFDRDGKELIYIAEDFFDALVDSKDDYIYNNWTIYIFPTVNPDGVYHGTTNNGPGRTTLYSWAPNHKGIDINRSWQTDSDYKIYTSNRNYNGTSGFQAYEAEHLRDFILSKKSNEGKNVLIDLHGWEDSLIGSEDILDNYFAPNFTSAQHKYGRFGTQYLITWARANGMQTGLVELPSWIGSHRDAVNANLSGKYIDSVFDMLRNMPIVRSTNTNSLRFAKKAIKDYEEFDIAFAGVMKQGLPNYDEIELYIKDSEQLDKGLFIDTKSKDKILEIINSLTIQKYTVNEKGYLEITENDFKEENKYDVFISNLINSENTYILSNNGTLYYKDKISNEIQENFYEDLDPYQTYDYVQNSEKDKMIIDIPIDLEEKLTSKEIFDSLIDLFDIMNNK